MMVRSRSSVLAAFCAVLGLLLLPGCEDQVARDTASDLNKQLTQLKAELSVQTGRNDELYQKLKTLHEDLEKQVAQRLDKLSSDLSETHKKVLDQFTADSERTRTAATNIANGMRADYEKSLAAEKTDIARDLQKIRDELKAYSDDLRKYMDNQLRELYPYAFQPRRMDPNAPPPPEAK